MEMFLTIKLYSWIVWNRTDYLFKMDLALNNLMVIVVGNGHGDTSSNPEWDWLHFT